MRELMHDIAALAVRMVRVIVYDRATQSARNGNCREGAPFNMSEMNNFRTEAGEWHNTDFEMLAHSKRV